MVKIRDLKAKIKNHTTEDTTLANLLSELSFTYHTISPDSTQFYASKSLVLSKKINYVLGEANSYKHLAIAAYIFGENKKAIFLNSKALTIYRNIGERKGEGAVLNNLGMIYHNEGKFDLGLSYYERSLKIRLEINDKVGIAGSYNNIANCYTDKGNYALAIQRLYDGLLIRESLNDTLAIANSYANIAGVYYLLKKLDEAIIYGQKALDLQRLIGDKEGQIQSEVALGGVCFERDDFMGALDYFLRARANSELTNNLGNIAVAETNLGEVYNALNKPDSAIFYLESALGFAQRINDAQGVGICELGIGKALVLKNQVKQGILRLEKGYKVAEEIDNKLHTYEGAMYLADAYEKIGNTEKEIYYLKQSIRYRDSLFSEEARNKTYEIEFNYMLEKKQNEIALLEKDKAIQKVKSNFQVLLTSGLVVVVCILILFIFFINKFRVKEKEAKGFILKQKNEIEEQRLSLEELNLYKDKTFSILSHDLRSPISSLTNVLELMDQEVLSEEDFILVRSSFIGQLKAINLLLDNTLHWSKSQMSGEHLPNREKVQLLTIVERNFELFKQNVEQKEINLKTDFADDFTVFVDPNHLDIILRNLIFNAIKFTPNFGNILVKGFLQNNSVIIQVEDTGIGMNKEILDTLFTYKNKQGSFGTNGERGAGIGLILTRDFIERNQGELTLESKENVGTTFTVTFPVL
ncbi:MAG: tetratricopeptide repeat-containing sensor histidine kinase [Bacteroidia bacterium]|nr:tetratricopeptide repeat-containing sensor histidine kinase [Bacteroidia bacterium]